MALRRHGSAHGSDQNMNTEMSQGNTNAEEMTDADWMTDNNNNYYYYYNTDG